MNTINPDILVRIGTMRPQEIRSGMGEHFLPVDKKNGKGGALTLTAGWMTVERNFQSKTDLDALKSFQPLSLKISRNSPEITIKKSHNYTSEDADRVIDFYKDHPNFIHLNDPKQFDQYSGLPVQDSPQSSAEWYIEDMREARTQKVSKHKETANILRVIDKNEANEKWLRDALFILGEVPQKDDTIEEMYGAITDLVIENPKSEQRKKFVEVYLEEKIDAKQIEAEKWLAKAVSLSIVQFKDGMFCYGANKLGSDEAQAVSQLMFDTDVYRAVRAAVSEKSDLPEDKETFKEIKEQSNGAVDEAKGIAWVSDKLKASGLYKNPGVALKDCSTVSEAVTVFNNKVKTEGLGKEEYITTEMVMGAIA